MAHGRLTALIFELGDSGWVAASKADVLCAGRDRGQFFTGVGAGRQVSGSDQAQQAIDVIISNCVINLSTDKPAVFAEMARVLKPGGRIGISDVVADDSLTSEQRLERGSWVGCIAGALSYTEYYTQLRGAGFTDITIEATHQAADGMDSAIIRAAK